MRLKPEQIERQLRQSLAPVYLISGDEPLQLGEVADAVRAAAKDAGFSAREIFSEDAGVAWNALRAAAATLSIFSDKKIVDLRLPSASPGVEGSKVLVSYCDRPPEETLLLITMGKLGADSMKSKWFQALDKAGVVVQVWPPEGRELLRWLEQRLQQRGLAVDPEGLNLLASRVEGNLLAAAQEIEKLYVLYGTGRLSHREIAEAVADNSRYDVYKLIDCILAADVNKIIKILRNLEADGIAAPIVLWALTREARILIRIKQALALGQARELVFRNHQIREKRQPLVGSALGRLRINGLQQLLLIGARADRQIKGQERGDPWETLMKLSLFFAGAQVLDDAG